MADIQHTLWVLPHKLRDNASKTMTMVIGRLNALFLANCLGPVPRQISMRLSSSSRSGYTASDRLWVARQPPKTMSPGGRFLVPGAEISRKCTGDSALVTERLRPRSFMRQPI